MKRILPVLLAAAALSAPADTKIATVDFGLAYLAHPQTPRNHAELVELKAKFTKQRDERLAARDRIKTDFEAARAIALDPVQGAAARDQASAKAKDLQMQYVRATEAVQELADELQRKLQRREGELLADVMIDIRSKIEEIAKAKGYDLVLDKKAANVAPGFPTPIFLYASDAIDITDDVIAAIGGSREQAEKDQAALLDRASELFGREPASAAPAAGSETPAPAADPATEAK